MKSIRLAIILIVLVVITSCNNYNIKYDDAGNVVSMNDPGDYSSWDKIMLQFGNHDKTDAYILYSEFLMNNDMEEVGKKKIEYATQVDTSYWLVDYARAFLNEYNEPIDSTLRYLQSALIKYDGEREWGKVIISKENIYRNLSYLYYINDGMDYYLYSCRSLWYDAGIKSIEYGKQAMLLSDKKSREYQNALNMVTKSYFACCKYKEVSEWVTKHYDSHTANSINSYCDKLINREDSFYRNLLPDYPVYKYCHNTFLSSWSYGNFHQCYTVSNYKDLKESCQDIYKSIQEFGQISMPEEEFYERYFSYFENDSAYFSHIHLNVERMK